MIRTWMDSVMCFAVIGLTFEVLENITYIQRESIALAAAHNLAPVHSFCGVIIRWRRNGTLNVPVVGAEDALPG